MPAAERFAEDPKRDPTLRRRMSRSTASAARVGDTRPLGTIQPAWREVKPLLAQLLEQPADERERLLERLCVDDAAMRGELQSLLAAERTGGRLLRKAASGLDIEALTTKSTDRRVGQRIGPWRLVAPIASGGQGEVWRAERADGQFEQRVAIKLLHARFDREWLMTRFDTERRILASLDHPHLARLLDGGTTDDGLPYIVMELVEGDPIDRYCTRVGSTLDERLALFRTVCQVVGYAHGKGIVHRDLKCDNILVTAQGAVKLVDFGIAKRIDAERHTTATAQRMMTLAYSSPEQVRGEHASPASDVYSLGVVLYRLLTNTRPYARATRGTDDGGYALARAICEAEPPLPSRADPPDCASLTRAQRRRLRGDLDAIVMMALRKEPARRYADATAFGNDVHSHQDKLPVRARRGALGYRAQRFVLRHRPLVAASTLTVAGLLAGVTIAVQQSHEAERQRDRAQRHLAAVRESAHALVEGVHHARRDVTTRMAMIERGLAYLQQLSADSDESRRVRYELATAYRRLAEVQYNPAHAHLGDASGARENAERARALYESAIASEPENAVRQRSMRTDAMRALRLLARIEHGTGHTAAARAHLERAVAMWGTQLSAGGGDEEGARVVTNVYLELSRLDALDSDPNVALAWLQRADEVMSTYERGASADEETLRARAKIHRFRADVYVKREEASGDKRLLTRALAEVESAHVLFEQLRRRQPMHASASRDLAVCGLRRGEILQRSNRLSDALAAYRAGWTAMKQLSDNDAADSNARTDLAIADSHLGMALVQRGDIDAGRAHLDAAIKWMEPMASAGTLDHGARSSLAKAHAGSQLARRKRAPRLEVS